MSTEPEHFIETYKSVLTIGIEATKSMLLLNGGAVIAMLTYIGSAQHGSELAVIARLPIGLFVAGLTLAMLAGFFGYQCQLTLLNEQMENPQKRHHMFWQKWTMTSLVLSLIAFVAGAFCALPALG